MSSAVKNLLHFSDDVSTFGMTKVQLVPLVGHLLNLIELFGVWKNYFLFLGLLINRLRHLRRRAFLIFPWMKFSELSHRFNRVKDKSKAYAIVG